MRRIEQIANERHTARMWLDGISQMNVANKTPEERVEIDIQFARARAEWSRLNNEYQTWIRTEASGSKRTSESNADGT